MLKWIERKWGLCHDFVPQQRGTRFLSAHTAAWSASLQKIGNGSLLLVQKQDINNSLRKHKHNYAEEYSCSLLETAECKFSPGFLDKNRGIHYDRWRMNKSTSKKFFDSFLFVLVCRRMKSCSVITQSILFNITGIVYLFLFYFLKKSMI